MDINLERLRRSLQVINDLATNERGGVDRIALTEVDRASRNLLALWMREAELGIRIDDLGNMYGRREGTDPEPPIAFGSHLDTVPNGGRFDGTLGVIAGLEVMRTIQERGLQTRRPLELINFTNEEGIRFSPAMLASGALAGHFTSDYVDSRHDHAGMSFTEALSKIGYRGNVENRLRSATAFLELHIEQGPVLETEGYPIGIVEGTQGIVWMEVTFVGQSSFAGTAPMALRRDALVAAARLIMEINRIAQSYGKHARGTVGRIAVDPGIVTSIPGRATISVDLRHTDPVQLAEMQTMVNRSAVAIGEPERMQIQITESSTRPPIVFHAHLINTLETVAARLGLPYRRLVSGSGHDAFYMARLAPAAMIFVRSLGGKSHSPDEDSEWIDIHLAVRLLLHTIISLAA